MAVLQLTCKDCQHIFFDIDVQCTKKISFICPLCDSQNIGKQIIPPQDGTSAYTPCKHHL